MKITFLLSLLITFVCLGIQCSLNTRKIDSQPNSNGSISNPTPPAQTQSNSNNMQDIAAQQAEYKSVEDEIKSESKKYGIKFLKEVDLSHTETEIRIWVGFGMTYPRCFILKNQNDNRYAFYIAPKVVKGKAVKNKRGEVVISKTSLQSEGVEVENNTTFISEESDADAETSDETIVSTIQEEATSMVDDLDTRRNPFTGLEDWAITVNESPSDDFDNLDSFQETKDNNTLSFNFDASCDESSSEETDIFLSPPDEIEKSEKADESNVTSAETDICYSSKTLSKPLAKKTKAKTKSSQGKEQKQSPKLPQTGFLW